MAQIAVVVLKLTLSKEYFVGCKKYLNFAEK